MKKRGAVQQKKERIQRVTDILTVVILTLTAVVLIFGVVQEYAAVRQWNSGKYRQYSGDYTVRKIVRHDKRHSTRYVFELENGDTVDIWDRYLDPQSFADLQEILDAQQAGKPVRLVFSYASCEIPLLEDNALLSLEEPGGTVYVEGDQISKTVASHAGMLLVIFFLAVLPLIAIGFVRYHQFFRRKRKRKANKKRQP